MKGCPTSKTPKKMGHSPSTIQGFQFRDYDPSHLREVINGADLEHTILEPKTCSADVWQWRSEGVSIDSGFYNFPVFVRGRFAKGQLCLGISRGRQEPTWINGYHLDRGSLQVYAEGAEMLYRAGPSTDWVGITVSRELLQNSALKHFGSELTLPASGMRNCSIPPASVDLLMQLVRQSREPQVTLKIDPQWHQSQILRACVEALMSGELDEAEKIKMRRRYRTDIFRRADAVIRSLIDAGSGYSSPRICRALGLSERNLQLHFKDSLGMSPKMWFRQLALARVRSELIRQTPKPGFVAEVAMKYGFDHLGRFSQDYRKIFGELPSTTLRRAPVLTS